MFGEEILLEIDDTLDRLIYNAEAIQSVDLKDLSTTEIDAFQKTQESLLQHLMHMDQLLVAKKSSLKIPIQEKLRKFEKMKNSYHKSLSEIHNSRSILSKRRGKRLITKS